VSTSISGHHVPLLAGFALCAEKLALTEVLPVHGLHIGVLRQALLAIFAAETRLLLAAKCIVRQEFVNCIDSHGTGLKASGNTGITHVRNVSEEVMRAIDRVNKLDAQKKFL
jgi:hypothetical protein